MQRLRPFEAFAAPSLLHGHVSKKKAEIVETQITSNELMISSCKCHLSIFSLIYVELLKDDSSLANSFFGKHLPFLGLFCCEYLEVCCAYLVLPKGFVRAALKSDEGREGDKGVSDGPTDNICEIGCA